jgi:methionyl aminopeptidase
MAWLKTKKEIDLLREGGKLHARILEDLKNMAKPGMSTKDLNDYAEQEIRKAGDKPSFLNYQPYGADRPYPASLCVSVNDEIVHGIPSKKRILKEGDIVTCDLGVTHNGLITDAAITFPVGKISKEVETLLKVTEESLMAGIKAARAGNHVGDIGAAVFACSIPYGYGVVRDLGGHGVGHQVHEDPHIPNFGRPGSRELLEPGMVLAIEPMFTLGTHKVKLLKDGYTFSTADHSLSAHFEHTIAITKGDPIILTVK